MTRTESTFLTVCAAIIAFAATYYINPKAPRYYPIERRWSTTNDKEKPSMGWYGRSAWGLGVGLVVGIAAAVMLRGKGRTETPTLPGWLIGVLTVLTLLALVGVGADIVHHEFGKWGTWGTWGTWHVPS
jgi:hypothetical protein